MNARTHTTHPTTRPTTETHTHIQMPRAFAPGLAAPADKGLQPQPMSNWSAFFFFVAFVVVVSYTLLNLYIGEDG